MKTRIKIIEDSRGNKEYIPQFKRFIFGWGEWSSTRGDDVWFDTEQEALDFLKEYKHGEKVSYKYY